MAWTARGGRRLGAAWLVAAAAGACAGLPVGASAQDQPQKPVGAAGAKEITGRDFAGVRFKQAVVPGKLSFLASKVWTWSEGATHRLVLEGDVRVTMASYRFHAKRAVAWLEPVAGAAGKETEQVFIYFEELGSAGDPAGATSMATDRLPVRGVIEVDGAVEMGADVPVAGPPTGKDAPATLVKDGEAALRRVLRRELGLPEETAALPPLPRLTKKAGGAAPAPPTPAQPTPAPAGEQPIAPAAPPGPPANPQPPSPESPATGRPAAPTPTDVEHEPIFSHHGVFALGVNPQFGEIKIVSGTEENAIIMTGGVVAQYQDQQSGRVLQMTAQRAVAFLDPGHNADLGNIAAEKVHAIYLEGDVTASDGKLTLRAPRICYDVRTNKAFMVDAVFWTYDEFRHLPLYVRAKTIRQESAREIVAKDALVTNSPFFDPELAIGASTVTISKQEREVEPPTLGEGLAGPPQRAQTQTRTIVDAGNITARVLGVPIFWWPTYSGDPSSFPLKDLRFENRSESGGAVKATFNAYALLGLTRPGDITADLMTDYYFERGPAMGTKIAWDKRESKGGIEAYSLFSDRGTDVLKQGSHLEHDGEFRGFLSAEERYRLAEHWTAIGEIATVSDANFLTNFFPQVAEERREFADRLELRRMENNGYLSLAAKGTTQDFLVNEYLLQSQGYMVQKVPEAYYARQADDLLAESYPGLLTYSSEYRAGHLSLAFDEETAATRGYASDAAAQRAFGINANQSIAQRLRAEGLFESPVNRLDTRQELSVQTSSGPVQINPFVVGRVTFWDDSFDALSPGQNSHTRLWSAAGMHLSTTFQRVYDSVDSSLLDLHRLRHIVEPNATVWWSGTSVEASDLPVYDKDVEQLADGGMAKIGMTQTFQTQRGGPGQWHSVDLLTLSTDFVFSSNDAPITSPIGRFFDYRPELSSPGNFFVVDGVMRLTDATSLTGGVTYDMDARHDATHDVGLLIRQSPQLIVITDLRYINAMDSTYVNLGASYLLTDKYSANFATTYDATHGGFQSTIIELRRRFSSMMLGVSVSYNDITGESSLGLVWQPYGASETRLSGVGGTDPVTASRGTFR
jgi:LPS transport system D